ncbi:MAG: glycosyltransferase family 4 protein [Zoogloeaceae bacterium]|jgi:glycosyltransferase involved in cell wall biosynthesis|nr:glycosyltransferase family 4 protein [Zoogloeaceae bacterium]
MRIAFLCKRRYMGKDVILDRYARLYEIPHQLARLGHEVCGFCLSYQGHEEGQWRHEIAGSGSLEWCSRTLGRLILPGLLAYPAHILRRVGQFRPDVLVGASDIPHVALAQWLSTRLNVPYAVDLYDNFEGFGQARIPGLVKVLRRATRHAALVTTTSDLLKELVETGYRARGTVISMPSTIDKAVFFPREKAACRRALGLPENAILVGTAGGLLANRGIDVLYEAWPGIAAEYPDARLVLAGPADRSHPPPNRKDVIYLGCLLHAKTAELFNALDLGIIYLKDTLFGRYCFPQKAYEMMACRLPIVAANVGAMPAMLENAGSLYQAESSASLAQAIRANIETPSISRNKIRDWQEIIAQMEHSLREIQRVHPNMDNVAC